MYVCMYKGLAHSALAPRPTVVYCASPSLSSLQQSHTPDAVQDPARGDVEIVTRFNKILTQVTES
jgi:hypothetical protein